MAVPDSLTSWREFVDRQPVEPRRMTMKQISGLSPDEKAAYDQERFAWLAADVVLETHDTVALTRQTRIIMARNVAKTATARRGLAMSGSSGLGKSTAALLTGKRHEKAMRKKTGRHDDNSYAPVVYGVVPPGTTPKMMMLAFANFLGLVSPNKATAQDLTERIVGVMRHLGTSLVICDEIHNLRTNHQAGSEAASALKVFSERLDATFLYAGIDLLQSDLLSGHMGRQIKGRITIHEMRPYSNGTGAQRDAWEELVLGIETLLPLGRHPEGSLASQTGYLYDRTGGSIGSLRALLSDGAIAAILDGAEKVDRKLLDTIPTDHAAEEFRIRTPVKQDGAPTPLRRAE
jgi:Bacterial TniB protein